MILKRLKGKVHLRWVLNIGGIRENSAKYSLQQSIESANTLNGTIQIRKKLNSLSLWKTESTGEKILVTGERNAASSYGGNTIVGP